MNDKILKWVFDIISLLFIIALLLQLREYTNQCKNYEVSIKCWYENQEYMEKLIKNLNFTYNDSIYICHYNNTVTITK